MQLLYWFEKIRNPVCDFLFSTVTHLGEEMAFLLISIIFFWCINKKHGYFILTSGLLGTLTTQTLKLACKIPRPFHNTNLTIVESARAEASGYSFPSGHSQSAVTTLGGIFLVVKKTWVKIVAAVLAGLVLISRMYLGVHTPWDVIAGASAAIVILLLLEDVFKKEGLFDKVMPFIVGALALFSIGYFIYATFFVELPSESHFSYDSVVSGKENAMTLLGCSLGLILVYCLDRFVIKFETNARWYAQLIKLIVGIGVILLIKIVVKIPLNALMGDWERILRYFLMVGFAGAVWPLTFGWFSKLEIPVLDRFGKWVVGIFSKKDKAAQTAAEDGEAKPEAVKKDAKSAPVDPIFKAPVRKAPTPKDKLPTYFGENSMFKKNKKKRK